MEALEAIFTLIRKTLTGKISSTTEPASTPLEATAKIKAMEVLEE